MLKSASSERQLDQKAKFKLASTWTFEWTLSILIFFKSISGIFCANPRHLPEDLPLLPVPTRGMPSNTVKVYKKLF